MAVSGETVVVGARFEDSNTPGVNNTPNESATDSGATYIFTCRSAAWTQEAYLKASRIPSDSGVGDSFGTSVAISDDTVVVGAPGEDSSTTGVNTTPNQTAYFNSGAAYVFVRSAGVWTQEAYLKPAAVGTSQEGDAFGAAVAVSGDTVVIGAPYEDSSTTGVDSIPNELAGNRGAF